MTENHPTATEIQERVRLGDAKLDSLIAECFDAKSKMIIAVQKIQIAELRRKVSDLEEEIRVQGERDEA